MFFRKKIFFVLSFFVLSGCVLKIGEKAPPIPKYEVAPESAYCSKVNYKEEFISYFFKTDKERLSEESGGERLKKALSCLRSTISKNKKIFKDERLEKQELINLLNHDFIKTDNAHPIIDHITNPSYFDDYILFKNNIVYLMAKIRKNQAALPDKLCRSKGEEKTDGEGKIVFSKRDVEVFLAFLKSLEDFFPKLEEQSDEVFEVFFRKSESLDSHLLSKSTLEKSSVFRERFLPFLAEYMKEDFPEFSRYLKKLSEPEASRRPALRDDILASMFMMARLPPSGFGKQPASQDVASSVGPVQKPASISGEKPSAQDIASSVGPVQKPASISGKLGAQNVKYILLNIYIMKTLFSIYDVNGDFQLDPLEWEPLSCLFTSLISIKVSRDLKGASDIIRKLFDPKAITDYIIGRQTMPSRNYRRFLLERLHFFFPNIYSFIVRDLSFEEGERRAQALSYVEVSRLISTVFDAFFDGTFVPAGSGLVKTAGAAGQMGDMKTVGVVGKAGGVKTAEAAGSMEAFKSKRPDDNIVEIVEDTVVVPISNFAYADHYHFLKDNILHLMAQKNQAVSAGKVCRFEGRERAGGEGKIVFSNEDIGISWDFLEDLEDFFRKLEKQSDEVFEVFFRKSESLDSNLLSKSALEMSPVFRDRFLLFLAEYMKGDFPEYSRYLENIFSKTNDNLSDLYQPGLKISSLRHLFGGGKAENSPQASNGIGIEESEPKLRNEDKTLKPHQKNQIRDDILASMLKMALLPPSDFDKLEAQNIKYILLNIYIMKTLFSIYDINGDFQLDPLEWEPLSCLFSPLISMKVSRDLEGASDIIRRLSDPKAITDYIIRRQTIPSRQDRRFLLERLHFFFPNIYSFIARDLLFEEEERSPEALSYVEVSRLISTVFDAFFDGTFVGSELVKSAGVAGAVEGAGTSGIPGSTGTAGVAGTAGTAGNTGTVGNTGTAGVTGTAGASGNTGAAGQAGDVGGTGVEAAEAIGGSMEAFKNEEPDGNTVVIPISNLAYADYHHFFKDNILYLLSKIQKNQAVSADKVCRWEERERAANEEDEIVFSEEDIKLSLAVLKSLEEDFFPKLEKQSDEVFKAFFRKSASLDSNLLSKSKLERTFVFRERFLPFLAEYMKEDFPGFSQYLKDISSETKYAFYHSDLPTSSFYHPLERGNAANSLQASNRVTEESEQKLRNEGKTLRPRKWVRVRDDILASMFKMALLPPSDFDELEAQNIKYILLNIYIMKTLFSIYDMNKDSQLDSEEWEPLSCLFTPLIAMKVSRDLKGASDIIRRLFDPKAITDYIIGRQTIPSKSDWRFLLERLKLFFPNIYSFIVRDLLSEEEERRAQALSYMEVSRLISTVFAAFFDGTFVGSELVKNAEVAEAVEGAGATEASGNTGAVGTAGNTGVAGTAGNKGASGNTGTAGNTGAAGQAGDVGGAGAVEAIGGSMEGDPMKKKLPLFLGAGAVEVIGGSMEGFKNKRPDDDTVVFPAGNSAYVDYQRFFKDNILYLMSKIQKNQAVSADEVCRSEEREGANEKDNIVFSKEDIELSLDVLESLEDFFPKLEEQSYEVFEDFFQQKALDSDLLSKSKLEESSTFREWFLPFLSAYMKEDFPEYSQYLEDVSFKINDHLSELYKLGLKLPLAHSPFRGGEIGQKQENRPDDDEVEETEKKPQNSHIKGWERTFRSKDRILSWHEWMQVKDDILAPMFMMARLPPSSSDKLSAQNIKYILLNIYIMKFLFAVYDTNGDSQLEPEELEPLICLVTSLVSMVISRDLKDEWEIFQKLYDPRAIAVYFITHQELPSGLDLSFLFERSSALLKGLLSRMSSPYTHKENKEWLEDEDTNLKTLSYAEVSRLISTLFAVYFDYFDGKFVELKDAAFAEDAKPVEDKESVEDAQLVEDAKSAEGAEPV